MGLEDADTVAQGVDLPADLFGAERETEFAAGAPDGFSRLWVPHRMAYVADHTQPGAADCPFCAAPAKSDADGLIVARGESAFVLMNLFPYNGGHVLVCPYRHISTYDEASAAEVAEIGFLTQHAMRVIKEVSGCHGFNIGMNQGEVAGAGIAAHLHQHIVPRWRYDSNFFPIIARTKALPQLLEEVRAQLASAWDVTS
ncbi:HIT family protein [Canibacter zhoujuaniae]|uniref:HIT family protein n=1 Tax=Canibacter zhoujuaniae TaxID=2708343 RepID=UPI0014223E5A|nr:HIT domain-containing protein [Canibacter zhoujuaniae]